MLLPVHVSAGLVALTAGAIALSATKGSLLHRRAGQWFAFAMAILTTTAIAVDALRNEPFSVPALLTGYLVLTGWLAVQDRTPAIRHAERGAAVLGAVIAIGAPFSSAHLAGTGQKSVATAVTIFGVVAALAVWGDVRMLRKGPPQGPSRLVRHLWRMGVAMLIATMSFFLGQAKVLPEAMRHPALLAAPVLLVIFAIVYSLVRVRRKKLHPASGPSSSTGAAPG